VGLECVCVCVCACVCVGGGVFCVCVCVCGRSMNSVVIGSVGCCPDGGMQVSSRGEYRFV
jgi:hypothetical protein